MRIENASNGTSALERLIAPITTMKFMSEYWQKKPLLVRRSEPSYFDALLTVNDLDQLLSNVALPVSQVNLGQNAVGISRHEYSNGKYISPVDVLRLHRLGNTIILRSMHSWLPKLRNLCAEMETAFLCDAQTNVYLTPAHTQSSYPHWDAHDIFVIQIAGSKDWILHQCEMDLPLPRYEFDPKKHPVGPEIGEIRLNPGDVAYIPRGCAHSPKAREYSIHISLGIKVKTWADVLGHVVEDAINSSVACREILPVNHKTGEYDLQECLERFPAIMSHLANDERLKSALGMIGNQFLLSRRPKTDGALSEIAQAKPLDLDTVVHIPNGSFIQMNPNSGDAVINGIRLRFDRDLTAPLEYLSETGSCRVGDLPADSDVYKLALAQKLIDEGCVIVSSG